MFTESYFGGMVKNIIKILSHDRYSFLKYFDNMIYCIHSQSVINQRVRLAKLIYTYIMLKIKKATIPSLLSVPTTKEDKTLLGLRCLSVYISFRH